MHLRKRLRYSKMRPVKSTLARLGIRNFKPTLRKAAERLATVHTPEGGVPMLSARYDHTIRPVCRLGLNP